MPKKEANSIKFFTKADGASGHYLSLAEPILRNFDKEKSIDDINDIIEHSEHSENDALKSNY